MRIIHVLRKPLSEGTVASNVLKHGTGGLNIDASRVGGVGGTKRTNGSNAGRPRNTLHGGNFGVTPLNAGRWPANVILQHLDGCRCDGVKKVKAISGGASSGDNAFGQDSGWNAHQNRPTNITRQGGKDGKETVANWICEPGCPVARLDEESGTSKSTSRNSADPALRSRRRLRDTPNLKNEVYGTGLGGVEKGNRVADSGGASRFYKQVGGGK